MKTRKSLLLNGLWSVDTVACFMVSSARRHGPEQRGICTVKGVIAEKDCTERRRLAASEAQDYSCLIRSLPLGEKRAFFLMHR